MCTFCPVLSNQKAFSLISCVFWILVPAVYTKARQALASRHKKECTTRVSWVGLPAQRANPQSYCHPIRTFHTSLSAVSAGLLDMELAFAPWDLSPVASHHLPCSLLVRRTRWQRRNDIIHTVDGCTSVSDFKVYTQRSPL